MAKPPAGSSLLFGALADSGRIKQRKNGSYRMVLKGVDEIDWFTDRPNRVAGNWSPKKLVRKWDGLFEDVEPNAQATFEMGSKHELVNFKMFKPKLSDSNQTLSFNIRGIGKKNKDLLTGLRNKQLSDTPMFITNDTKQLPSRPNCFPNCQGKNLVKVNLWGVDLSKGEFEGSNLALATMSGAKLAFAYFSYAQLGGVSLTKADLTAATLINANLRSATLTDANLYGVYMPGSDLTGAMLDSTNLTNARLDGSNLTFAFLNGATLTNANLTGADLTYADLGRATMTGALLEDAIWKNTTCPDGTKNSGTSPCSTEQLNLA